jgi:nucleoside-diphosphate-sugar epimerase
VKNIKNVCDAVLISKKLGCSRFVYPNTVMALSSINILSEDNVKPSLRSLYYTAKESANIMAKTLCFSLNISYIEVIITNIYGPDMNNPTFFNTMFHKLMKNEKCSLTSGDQLYDFIFITDAIEALYLIGEKGRPFNSYYLGSLCPKTIKNYIIEMKEILGSTSELGFGEIKTNPIGINTSSFDIYRLKNELNFENEIDYRHGVTICKNYYIQNFK